MVFGVKTYRSAETDLIQCMPKSKRVFFYTTTDRGEPQSEINRIYTLGLQAADPGKLKQANATLRYVINYNR